MTPVSIKHKIFILLAFVVIGFLIYSNTLHTPFHYDDFRVVSDLSFEQVLERCKADGSRVVCNLTFLLNYWLGGSDVVGYHIFNTLIHVGTAYFLFIFLNQILSLTNRFEQFERLERFKQSAAQPNPDARRLLPPLRDPLFWPAFLGAMLFLVHPLATQAVTYVTQRYASLAGFLYIGSLVFFVMARIKFMEIGRFLQSSHLIRYCSSLVMAILAMRTKEMAVSLPAALLLTEYSFMRSDSRPVKRLLYLLPLLSTGLIIPVSDMMGIENISFKGAAALQDYAWGEGVTRSMYIFTQFKVIAGIYLKLLVWPIGQNIDHYYVISDRLLDPSTMASFLILCLLLGIGLWLFKHSRLILPQKVVLSEDVISTAGRNLAFSGYSGKISRFARNDKSSRLFASSSRLVSFAILWFFVTISPTSSIIPNTEFVAEHRVYISLMGLAFAAAGLPAWQRRWKTYVWVLLPILLVLSGLTYARNKVWQTDLTLWEDAAAKSDKKSRPHVNLGLALYRRGRLDEAIRHYNEALLMWPDFTEAHYNLGLALYKRGDIEDAIAHYKETLRIQNNFPLAYNQLGLILADQGMYKEAITYYLKAVGIKADFAEAHSNIGNALIELGLLQAAVRHFSEAIKVRPDYAEAHNNLGFALTRAGAVDQAIVHFSEAVRINPGFARAHYNLGNALAALGNVEEAIAHFSEAVRTTPSLADAHNNLGLALVRQGNLNKAIDHYSKALEIRPDFVEAYNNLAIALAGSGRIEEAVARFSEALRIKPDYADAHYNMANALLGRGDLQEAITHYSKGLEIAPKSAYSHHNMGVALTQQGRFKDAIGHFSEALRIQPEYPDARRNLEIAERLAATASKPDLAD